MRTIKLRIAATETHCGVNWSQKCNRIRMGEEDARCGVFGKLLLEYVEEKMPKRLPECIAAEKEAGK